MPITDAMVRQTAEDLGISVGAVKSGASRGLDRLRQILGKGIPRPATNDTTTRQEAK